MSRKVLVLLALVGASACSEEREPQSHGAGDESGEHELRIDCAPAGSERFERACVVEQATTGEARFLVVRHPDGGFRRFQLQPDGAGLSVADGAQDARITKVGAMLEVVVGADRYRFPAQVLQAGPARDARP